MKYPKERYLFTVKDVCHTCGISRATLLRIEESGFLTPYKIDAKTGYRYYDAQNIAQIGQYQLLQKLGISRKEITDFYLQNIDVKEFINSQRQRISVLQRLLDELELRYTQSDNFIISYTDLPELTCYYEKIAYTSPDVLETFAYDAHQRMIRQGYVAYTGEPQMIFLLNKGSSANNDSVTELTLCLPTLPTNEVDSHLMTLEKCHAFSMVGYGNYSNLPYFIKRCRDEIAARKLVPIGAVRIIVLVAPYVGAHISPDNFCYEFVVPIEHT